MREPRGAEEQFTVFLFYTLSFIPSFSFANNAQRRKFTVVTTWSMESLPDICNLKRVLMRNN